MAKVRIGPTLKIFILGGITGAITLAILASAMLYTDQRPFCASCHVMEQAAVTHKLSAHANLSCNDCHAPHNILEKLPVKAVAGFNDVVANMLGKEEPFKANPITSNIVNNNCKSCHAITNMNVASINVKEFCVDCHRSIAHMRQIPISVRTVGDE